MCCTAALALLTSGQGTSFKTATAKEIGIMLIKWYNISVNRCHEETYQCLEERASFHVNVNSGSILNALYSCIKPQNSTGISNRQFYGGAWQSNG
jgi:hypothetical protein